MYVYNSEGQSDHVSERVRSFNQSHNNYGQTFCKLMNRYSTPAASLTMHTATYWSAACWIFDIFSNFGMATRLRENRDLGKFRSPKKCKNATYAISFRRDFKEFIQKEIGVTIL